jgi:hypothetical protein
MSPSFVPLSPWSKKFLERLHGIRPGHPLARRRHLETDPFTVHLRRKARKPGILHYYVTFALEVAAASRR